MRAQQVSNDHFGPCKTYFKSLSPIFSKFLQSSPICFLLFFLSPIFSFFLTVILLSSFFFESCFSFEGIFSTYQPCRSNNTRIKAKIPEPPVFSSLRYTLYSRNPERSSSCCELVEIRTLVTGRWRLECNNFASSLMSQNRTQWNLDFHFPLATLFLERIIQVYVIVNEYKLAPHLFE